MVAGMNTQSGPPQKRYGEYTTDDHAEIAVQVKSADFNGTSFDGRPFSAVPSWLHDAMMNGLVTPNTRRHTDYADWDIHTAESIKACRFLGPVVTAMPGDWIILRKDNTLSVVADQDAFILINLRPPVVGDSETPSR